MIVVYLESTVIWSEVFSEIYLMVQNRGPETLYCGENFEKENVGGEKLKETFISISRLKLIPTIGTDENSLVNGQDDISFEIVYQPSYEGKQNREWKCDYSGGVVELKPKETMAQLKSGHYIRIKVSVKEKSTRPGLGNIKYKFCDWKTSDSSVTDGKTQMNQSESELMVQKLPLPVVEQFSPDTDYPYKEKSTVHWKISNSESIENGHLFIDGEEYSNIADGSAELFMGDDKHVLELRESHNLSVVKKFFPRWFQITKMEQPEKKVPEKEKHVKLWWNITEAKNGVIVGQTNVKSKDCMDYSEWENKIELTYYDEINNKQSLIIDYTPPEITSFKREALEFIHVEKLKNAKAVVCGVYGGDDPWTPPAPKPKKETLILNCSCKKGTCYYKVNNGSIGSILPENQKKEIKIEVIKDSEYTIKIWDMYGCMVTKKC